MKTTQESLLQAIRDNPDEDTPRLLYAEYLDELPTRWVTCPVCGGLSVGERPVKDWALPVFRCKACNCNGSVVDRKPQDRAEFIRIQMKLANCGRSAGACQDQSCRCMTWARRSRELFSLHPEWASIPCPECGGSGHGPVRTKPYCDGCGGSGDLLQGRDPGSTHWEVAGGDFTRPHTFRRGFLHSVSATLAEWGEEVEVACPDCHGKDWHNEYGFDCERCEDARLIRIWQPTPLARAIAAVPGVCELGVVDIQPYKFNGGWLFGYEITSGWPNSAAGEGVVPKFLVDEMKRAGWTMGDLFPTPEAANTALARALWRLTRETTAKVE